MLDKVSIPRRSLDFEDYLDIFRRHIRWLIAPAFLGLVASTVVAFLWQDTFVSRASIRIVPPQVPDAYVPANVNQQLGERINAMAQSIESRGRLTDIINTYKLYPKDLKGVPMEDVINKMQKAIGINAIASPLMKNNPNGRIYPALQISYEYWERYTAQKVCAELVTRFINENLRQQEDSSIGTTQFLKDQYSQAKAELESIDKKLTDFRVANAGHLPEEMQSNVTQMNALEMRIQTMTSQLGRIAEDRMMQESRKQYIQNQLTSLKDDALGASAQNERLVEADRDIKTAQSNLNQLRQRYTEDHPDIATTKAQLAQLRQRKEDILKEEPEKSTIPVMNPTVARDRKALEADLHQTETALKAKDFEEKQVKREIDRATERLGTYQSRLSSGPMGEAVYTQMVRDREIAREKYQNLDKNMSKSAMYDALQQRKQGETLEILETASLPETPTAPKRYLIIPIGAALGLVLGVILVGVREMKDASLKNLKDVRLYTQLTILGAVPLLENDLVVQRRKQLLWVGWATATILGLAVMAGSIAYYYVSKV